MTGLTNTAGQLISPPTGATAVVVDLLGITPSINTWLKVYPADTTYTPSTTNENIPAGVSWTRK